MIRMTEKRAIRQLINLREHCCDMSKFGAQCWKNDIAALDVAIKCLKEEKEDIERLPEVKTIAKSVIDDIINKLTDLADHKIKPISFDQERVINMCIDIINNTIAESEEK